MKNRLQKKITKNQLLQNDTQLIRVLDMDCIKRTMPVPDIYSFSDES